MSTMHQQPMRVKAFYILLPTFNNQYMHSFKPRKSTMPEYQLSSIYSIYFFFSKIQHKPTCVTCWLELV